MEVCQVLSVFSGYRLSNATGVWVRSMKTMRLFLHLNIRLMETLMCRTSYNINGSSSCVPGSCSTVTCMKCQIRKIQIYTYILPFFLLFLTKIVFLICSSVETYLVVVDISGGGAPSDGQITCSCVAERQIPDSCWDWRTPKHMNLK